MKSEPDLICLQASDKEMDLYMSGTMQYKHKCLLPSTHKKLQTSCIYDIFWFFLKDENFVSKTINDSSIDLEKFPASKVSQLAKKIEASKATACHIKQVASDPHAAQINLMRHQPTDLPPIKHKKKHYFKSRPPSHKQYSSEHPQVPPYKKKFDHKQAHTRKDKCSKCGDPNIWKVSSVLLRGSV